MSEAYQNVVGGRLSLKGKKMAGKSKKKRRSKAVEDVSSSGLCVCGSDRFAEVEGDPRR